MTGYNNNGQFVRGQLVDSRMKAIDKLRKQTTYIETELMMNKPDEHVIQSAIAKILDILTEHFLEG